MIALALNLFAVIALAIVLLVALDAALSAVKEVIRAGL